MPSRLALAAVVFLPALYGCGSVTPRGDDDDVPSDDATDVDDGGDEPDGASDAPEDGGDQDGGDDDGLVEPTCMSASGTRLRQHVRRHSDGSSFAPGQLHDSELGVDCSFVTAADGSLRCLPDILGPQTGGFGQGRLVYTGSDCVNGPTIEAFPDVETGAPPTYARDSEYIGSCQDARRHFYELGADRGIGSGETLYARAVSGCFPFETGLAHYYAIERELPVTAFVGGAPVTSDTGRLAMTAIEAEDGARLCEQVSLVDDQLGACQPLPDETGRLRCLVGADDVRLATTSECGDETFGVALVYECQAPTLAREPLPTCGGYRVRELASPPTEPVYDQTCEQIDDESSSFSLFLLGETIDPGRFVPMDRALIAAGDRLERVASTTEGGLALATERWFDRELGVDCFFGSFYDPATRCVPLPERGTGVSRAERLYTDAGCSAEILLAASLACEEGAPPPRVLAQEAGGDGGDGTFELLLNRVGARHEGALYRLGDACEPIGPDEVFYDVGAPIPLESLVTVVVEDEIE